MTPDYVPILRTKAGEFSALENLSANAKQKTIPLFDVPRFTESTSKLAVCKNKPNPKECYLNDVARKIAATWENSRLFIDMHNWPTNQNTESGEHAYPYLIRQLNKYDILTTPVVGYDRWEDNFEYQNAIKSIESQTGAYCLRLESYAFLDMLEDHFGEVLDEIINSLDVDTSKCSVVLDFGDLTNVSIFDIEDQITRSLKALEPYNFSYISIAGCSITTMINDMVPEVDSERVIVRKEMVAWKSIKKFTGSKRLVFGDYGVVNPTAQTDVKAPHANGKIRYTIANNYFVARGHSRMKGNKWAQMHDLADIVVSSQYYMSQDFSWGDSKIMDCSNRLLKGSPCNWVSFDTNHHISAVLSEVYEFNRTVILSNELETI